MSLNPFLWARFGRVKAPKLEYKAGFVTLVTIWTPQHSPNPDPKHYAFNFENSGWRWSWKKCCYEIWMKQEGFIDVDGTFTPTSHKRGSHKVYFSNVAHAEKFANRELMMEF